MENKIIFLNFAKNVFLIRNLRVVYWLKVKLNNLN